MDERNLELLENCSDNMSNSRTTETAGLSSRTDDGDDDKWTGPVYLELTESRGGTDQGTEDNSTPSKRTPVKWAKFNIFLACLCFVALCESCIVRGYSGAILTTLQKQFGFTTRQSGLICTSYEFGHIPFVIIVSLLSKRYNRSKLIGAGGLLMGLGCVVYLVPMFITFYNPSLLHNVATDTSDPDSEGYRGPGSSGPMLCSSTNLNSTSTCTARSGASTWMVAILCVAQCILGIGASPIYTLGLTYLYENIPKRSRYPIYSGMMYALAGLGPVLGFGMASYFLNIYVLPWSVPESLDSPTHPQFVGAWWIGLLVCTAITFSAAIPLFFFPDRYGAQSGSATKSHAYAHDEQIKETLTSNNANGHTDSDVIGEQRQFDNDEFREPEEPVNMDFGQSCANIPRSLKLIFQARIWVGVTIVLIAENSVVVWFATYFPKYLETTFHVQRASASIMTGLILIPAACSGVISGGLIAKKLKRTVAIIKYLFCITVINMLMQFSSIFIRCDQLQFAGVTSTHDLSAMRILPQSRVDKLTMMNQTLRDRCNANCDCSFNEYAPVCASVDGRALTFYNPCFAGCTSYTSQNWTEGDTVKSTYAYYNCSCAAAPPPFDNYTDVLMSPAYNATWLANPIITLSNGVCSVDCNMLIPFIVVIFFIVFVVTSGQNPTLILTLQSVGDEHRSFALAVQTFFIRTLAYLPAPIYFGQLFDAQCILTQPDSCESNEDSLSIGYYSSGYCILYDSAMLAYTMLGCTLMLKAVALLSVIFCWVSAKQMQKRKSRTPEKPRVLEITDVTNVDNYDEQQDTARAMQHGNVTPSHTLNHTESEF